MNKAAFYKIVRESLFSGKLSQTQADGIKRIVEYRDSVWPEMPDAELAYVLATAKHESAHTMQPIKERGSRAYLMNKKYWPWIGRGLVQISWKENYDKFGIKNPDDALKWDVALDIAFRGMIYGMFTGVKLADCHSSDADGFDEMKARSIIQGKKKKSDPYAAQAAEVALIYRGFRNALAAAKEEPAAGNTQPVPADEDQTTGKPMAQSTTLWAQIAQWLAAGGAATVAALGAMPWQTALVFGGIGMVAAGIWIIRERWLKSKVEGV